jgi:hypothetical protein
MRMYNANGQELSRLIIGQGNYAFLHVCNSLTIQNGWIMNYTQIGVGSGITHFEDPFIL